MGVHVYSVLLPERFIAVSPASLQPIRRYEIRAQIEKLSMNVLDNFSYLMASELLRRDVAPAGIVV
jgi:hypothetical protein